MKRRTSPSLLIGCYVLLGLCASSNAQTTDQAVEAQPLASNVRRVHQALDGLGYPLKLQDSQMLAAALQAMDAEAIQRAIDSNVMAIVTISPEERVSVSRGAGKIVLQQAGYVPAIVKILNHSTSTARLMVSSPQSGPIYAGTATLSMQRQQQTQLLENQNESHSQERFLSIELYDAKPMNAQLSGLEVEYAIVLLAANEAGKREAVLNFDIGEGTADLEHRNELPVLFEIDPAVPLRLSIADEHGEASIARLEFRDGQGRVYPLQAKRLAPDFFFQSHVYRRDGEIVLLPPGNFNVQFSRGPEYRVQQTTVALVAGQDNLLSIQLERWFDAAAYGFFSGDHHIHAAGCAHYTHPTEGVSPADMFRQVQGEGLNVGCVLTWGPCFEYQRQFFGAEAELFGTRDTLLKYDLEISGFGSQALGHVCLLNLRDQIYPGSEGSKLKGWPSWTTPVMRWAKEQGGYAGYAHSASGMAIDPVLASKRMLERCDTNLDGALQLDEVRETLLPFAASCMDLDQDQRLTLAELKSTHERAADELPNLAIPEMNGVGAMEICVSTVAGVCDFISAMDTRRIQEWNTWYHLLNCGFPLKVSGETDFPCMSSRRVGKGRVYVHLGQNAELNFGAWCRGLADGKSYVSDGYAHLPTMTVGGVAPGYGAVQLEAAGPVRVTAQVAFAPQTPAAVAYGTLPSDGGRADVGDTVILHRDRSEAWIDGGQREVEIVVNGEVASKHTIPADGQLHAIDASITIERSSWVAIRHFPQMHSNPVNVIVRGAPIRASRSSARWCIEMTELLWKNREKSITPAERPAARVAFEHALVTLSKIAEESTFVLP